MNWAEHYKTVRNRIEYEAPMKAGKIVIKPLNAVPIERVQARLVPEFMPEASPETEEKILCEGIYPYRLKPLLAPILKKHKMPYLEAVSQSRKTKYKLVRFEMYHVMREAGYSLPRIGEIFNRDHTTIMHGIKRWKEITGE
jgi:hypothetical protein